MSNYYIEAATVSVQWTTFVLGIGTGLCLALMSMGVAELLGWNKS